VSLLLDALQRSERTLSLAPADDVAPAAVAPETVDPPPPVAPAPVAAAAPPPPVRPTPAAASAREAAQTMVHAAAPPDSRVRMRRMVFGLLTGLGLSVASWLGWNYWQASENRLVAVVLPPVASAPAQPVEPDPAGAPPVDGTAPAVAEAQAAPLPAEPVAPAAVALSAQPLPSALEKLSDPARKSGPEAASVHPNPPAAPRAIPVPATQDPAAPGAVAPARPAPAVRDAVAPGAPRSRPAAPPAAPELVRSLAQRHLQEAWSALGQGDAARAQVLYRQVLAERPDDPDATLGLAVALHRQKQLQEAWTAYQRSLQLWPDNATARTGLLAILSESDPATAESRLQEWVQARPRDAAAQAALGNLLGRQGRWAEALGPLTLAQSLAPEQAAYAYNLAVALDQSRRYAEALRLYRQALQLGGAGIPVQSVEYRQAELQELLSQ